MSDGDGVQPGRPGGERDGAPGGPSDGERPSGRPSVAHLTAHRRLVLERALVAGAVGLIPLPVLDDLAASVLRARLIRRIAELRRVDLAPSAVLVLSDERQSTMLRHATLTAVSLVALRYAWRKVFLFLALGRRLDEVVHTFQVGILFDHYCATHHDGAVMEGAGAARLRYAIEQAGGAVNHEVLAGAIRRSLRVAARTATGVPRGVASLLGQAARGLRFRSGGRALEEVAETLEEEGLFGKAARIVDEEVGAAADAYLGSLVERFETVWGQLQAQAGDAAPEGSPPSGDRFAPGGEPGSADPPSPEGAPPSGGRPGGE